MGRTLALAICVIVAALLAWHGEQPPRPASVTAPSGAFSAARAFADVEVVARAPHPAGSPANAAVRDHLMRRLTDLGLSPRLRRDEAFSVQGATVLGGRAESIVGILPGRDRALSAVAIMAHYDSEPSSPGAADDAAGVAAALETVRALKAGAALSRDVAVILTDGEEVGLLGARGFFAGDPLARRIGFLVNLEARGGGGRARMFETGPDNGETVSLFARAAPAPSASSLAVFLYGAMPNDTDFTIARAAGVAGLNLAFIGRQFDYHSASSTPAALDRGSLQDLGNQALAAVRAAASSRHPLGRAPDFAFHQLPAGGPLIAYPAAWGWALIAASGALLAIAALRARRAGALPLGDVARGAGAALFLLTACAVVLHAARQGTGAGFGLLAQQHITAQAARFETALVLLGLGVLLFAADALARGRRGAALIPLAAAGASLGLGGAPAASLGVGAIATVLALAAFRRPAQVGPAWIGILLILLAAALAVQAAAGPAAPVVAWPLLAGSALAAVSGLWTWRPWPVWVLTLAGATLSLAWLGGIVHGIYLGLDMAEVLAAVVVLAAGVGWPLMQSDPRRAGTPFAGAALLLAGVVLVAWVRLDPPWSARHPMATRIVYHQDLASGEAWRLNAAPAPSAWARGVLTADGGALVRRAADPVFERPVAAARAAPIAAASPRLTLTREPGGGYALTAAPPPGASSLTLRIAADRPLNAVTLGGRPAAILARSGQPARIEWRPAADGFVLRFHAQEPGALSIRYGVVIPSWPADAKPLPPRPADVMAYGISDSTLVTGGARLTWADATAKEAP